MRKLSLRILVALMTISISLRLSWLLHHLRQPHPAMVEPVSYPTPTPADQSVTLPYAEDDARPSNFLEDQHSIQWNGYLIERKTRTVNDEPGNPPSPVELSYVSIERSRKLIRTFHANVRGFGGNSAEFAFFPFLGPSSNELFITQDVFRGGCQWVVSLSPFRVIFDGQKFGVGRESADLRAEDLDDDLVKEIIVPLTDFYEFQDKMSISQIPLPEIVFKYNSRHGEYLPANPLFKSQDLRLINFAGASTGNEMEYRSIVLHAMTELIYGGRRAQAWQIFHRDYRLADKLEFERRLKTILKNQPVYRFIYQHRN